MDGGVEPAVRCSFSFAYRCHSVFSFIHIELRRLRKLTKPFAHVICSTMTIPSVYARVKS